MRRGKDKRTKALDKRLGRKAKEKTQREQGGRGEQGKCNRVDPTIIIPSKIEDRQANTEYIKPLFGHQIRKDTFQGDN